MVYISARIHDSKEIPMAIRFFVVRPHGDTGGNTVEWVCRKSQTAAINRS